ncbi:MAG: hypothetical protein GF370_00745 [Candidatus Nealsonbacteria bacterium]|nr:hypothetical protein [Candidatus Nealsonbacteria bacterium]
MKTRIKIGILGISWSNIGSRTMARVIINEFSKRATKDKQEISFKIFLDRRYTHRTSLLDDLDNQEQIFWRTGKIQFLKDLILIFLYKVSSNDFFIDNSTNLKQISSCNFLIGANGYCFHNTNGIKSIIFSLSRPLFSFLLKKRVYLFPQSFGPFESKCRRFLYRFVFPKIDKIYVRGEESEENLSQIIERELIICPDMAFLFDVPERYYQKNRLNNKTDLKKIGIVPNIKLKKKDKNYIDRLAELVSDMANCDTCKIFLIPHEIKKGKFDDLSVCEQIYESLNEEKKEKVITIGNEKYSAYDYKAIIGQLDVVIASRFHSAVAALSQEVPTITLAWSFKYKELMSWFGLENYNIDFNNFDVKKIDYLLEEIEKNDQAIKLSTHRKLPDIAIRLECLFDQTYQKEKGLILSQKK